MVDTRIPSLLTYTNPEGTLIIIYFEVKSNFSLLFIHRFLRILPLLKSESQI